MSITRLFLVLALASACSARPVDYRAHQIAVVAHELGHAGGLDHAPTGVMSPALDNPNDLPDAAAWRGPRSRDPGCRAWQAEDEILAQAVEIAGEAWCTASKGEWCPWVDNIAPCGTIQWGTLDDSTAGRWWGSDPERIEINEVYLP